MSDKKVRPFRNLVHLIAYVQDGKPVLEQFLNLDAYYEKTHPLLDNDEFRRTRKIIRVSGKKYDATGTVVEELELQYNEAGALVRDAARLADGTVVGDWEDLTAG